MLKTYNISSHGIDGCALDEATIFLYLNPDENEKKNLIHTLQVDEHTLHSALDPDELSRLEFEPNHLALIYKKPMRYSGTDQLNFKASTMGLFLFKDRLIIVTNEENNIFGGKLFTKVSSLLDVTLKLVYRSIYYFLEHLKVVNIISEELEQKIHKSMENKYLINLFALEKSLVYYLNSITSNSVLIEKLKLSSAKIRMNQEQLELLDDMIIENNQCYRQAKIYSDILASMMDARASIVSNNLNVLMKTLNIITISIMVPTLVVSVFSMNVRIPFQHLVYAFWIIMVLAGISVVSFLWVWKHHRW